MDFLEGESKLILRGWNCKMSDIIQHKNWTNATSIEIFALDTLTFDADIIKSGQSARVLIIAPKWKIHGIRFISLNGKHGINEFVGPAANGTKSGEDEKDGMSGADGTPGGSFFGFGDEFSEDGELVVRAGGSHGAPGQNGGNGEYYLLLL